MALRNSGISQNDRLRFLCRCCSIGVGVDTIARLIILAVLAWAAPAWSSVTYQGSTAFVSPTPITHVPDAGAEIQRILEGSKWPVIVKDKEFIKIGNTKIPIELSRKIPSRGAAGAVVRAAGVRGLIVTAAVIAAWCKWDSGSFVCDRRHAQSDYDMWRYQGGPGFPSATRPTDAASAAITMLYPGAQVRNLSCRGNPPIMLCNAEARTYNEVFQTYNEWEPVQVGVEIVREKACPPVVNFPDPAYSVPGGPPDFQGKCPSNIYEPRPVDEAEARVEVQLQKVPDASKVVKELLEEGIDLTPSALTNPRTVTGPSTAQEAPTTTTRTSPTGQPQTTTTQTTYNIRYGDNYTTNWTVTTVTNNSDGSTETKEETPKDEKAECEKNPDVIGCQKTDTPAGQDLEKRDIEVRYAPQEGWGAENAACPAPPNVSILGHSVQLDLSLFCLFFQGIRFALIGMAAMIGALIFIGGLKT